MNLTFEFLSENHTKEIAQFILLINDFTPIETLEKRVNEMFKQNYQCLGVFDEKKLIGICGMWFQTRHYSGYSLEVDHVVISRKLRSKGIGKMLFEFIETWAKENHIEAIELNTYKFNTRSHDFYENLDFIFKGRHYVKMLIGGEHYLKKDS